VVNLILVPTMIVPDCDGNPCRRHQVTQKLTSLFRNLQLYLGSNRVVLLGKKRNESNQVYRLLNPAIRRILFCEFSGYRPGDARRQEVSEKSASFLSSGVGVADLARKRSLEHF